MSPERRSRIAEGIALIEAFSQAAQSWGWESDQGHGSAIDRANDEFKRTRKELYDFIRKNVT